jgi:hypothetical protein
MKPVLRKVVIALFCFAVVLAFYLFIKGRGTSDDINSELLSQTGAKTDLMGKGVVDNNSPAIDENQIGQIGSVGFGNVEFARFTNFDKNGTLTREFGFKTLLHKIANRWEIEQPYMNIYQSRLNSYITADMGDVLLEEGTEKPVPKDVTLTGNVVIHIVPKQPEKFDESYIYLDDVTFFSASSRFTTAGPVRYVAKKAQLTGKGLEIIYNAEKDKLEMLRLSHLDSLIVKSSPQQASFFAAESKPERNTASPDVPEKTAENILKKTPVENQNKPAEQQKPVTGKNAPAQPVAPVTTPKVSSSPEQETYYKCAFSKNVLIESPGQLVLADEFIINNILWEKSSAPAENQPSVTSTKPGLAPVETQPAKKTQPQAETTRPGATNPLPKIRRLHPAGIPGRPLNKLNNSLLILS